MASLPLTPSPLPTSVDAVRSRLVASGGNQNDRRTGLHSLEGVSIF